MPLVSSRLDKGFPATLPVVTVNASITLVAAGYVEYMRVYGSGRITGIGMNVTTSAGAISVAVCQGSPGRTLPGKRLATSGVVASPPAGLAIVPLDVPVFVSEGDWFAISSDSSSFAVLGQSAGVAFDDLGLGLAAAEGPGRHPVPLAPAASAIRGLGKFLFGA